MKKDIDGIVIENLNFRIHERVFVKTYNTFGFIVDISEDGTFCVEKEGNKGPVYFDLEKDEIKKIKQE